MRLSELLARAGIAGAPPGPDPEVGKVTEDSRDCAPGALFAAIRGNRQDGAGFLADALERGAVAVLASIPRPEGLAPGVAWIERADPAAVRAALGDLAAAFHDFPGRALEVTGVTGTKGKTTTAFLLASISAAAGRPTALASTVQMRIGAASAPATLTTASAPRLQAFLAEARERGMTAAVIEVSSHALDQDRVRGIRFAAGVFTNLFSDHLDYHPTVEDYFLSKRRLFVGEQACARAAIQVDGRFGLKLAAEHPAAVTFGAAAESDVRPLSIEVSRQGTRVLAAIPGGRQILLDSPLLGRFNAHNLLAAAAWAISLGLPVEALREGVRNLEMVPGRMEPVDRGQPFTCLVDYSHMGPALAAALAAAREFTSGRLLVVLGAGGNRDPLRRRTLGEAAAQLADLAFITSDNPRDEQPEAIAAEIVLAFRKAGGSGESVILDRAQAIQQAVEACRPGDTLIVAGKGHETVQIVGAERRPFDDRLMLARALASRGYEA